MGEPGAGFVNGLGIGRLLPLLFSPLLGAVFLTVFGGVLMILFAVPLVALAWRMWQGGGAKAA